MNNPFHRSLAIAVICGTFLFIPARSRSQAKKAPNESSASAFIPVTSEMLRNPSPNDWLNWRRTYSGWGYSPLNQINRDNVQHLQMVWGFAMQAGLQEPTPLVYQGVMYLPNAGSVVDAVDAASGNLIWEYRRDLPDFNLPGRSEGLQALIREPMRNLSIFGDRVFLNTADGHVVALEARSGKVAWDAKVVDTLKDGIDFRTGSLVANGKVIVGLEGCMLYTDDKCAMIALDTETGKILWRLSTIAKPGEPGGDTWGKLPLFFRAGGDMWITGSYDPDLNLVYWGVTQAKPWARAARRTDGDALYTDSTIAVDPDTGKMVWHHQYVPGETEDMDDAFEQILVNVNEQKSLFEMGKLGILWQIDRQTGNFIHATDLGYQTLINVGPGGHATYRPGMIPKLNQEIDFCPSYGGIKNWPSMAYDPETTAFYIPLHPFSCEKAIYRAVKMVKGGGGETGVTQVFTPNPIGKGNVGELVAMDPSGKILWRHVQRTGYSTSALATAGGLVFVGSGRNIEAYDVNTGDLVWQERTFAPPSGFLITYSVNGSQYLAVPIGNHNARGNRPNTGNGIEIYALPEAAGRKP